MRRINTTQQSILQYIDDLVRKHFDKKYLYLLSKNKFDSISNHLLAFIQPPSLQKLFKVDQGKTKISKDLVSKEKAKKRHVKME